MRNYVQMEKEIDSRKVEQFLNNVNVINELAKAYPNVSLLKSYKGFGGLKQCFNNLNQEFLRFNH